MKVLTLFSDIPADLWNSCFKTAKIVFQLQDYLNWIDVKPKSSFIFLVHSVLICCFFLLPINFFV